MHLTGILADIVATKHEEVAAAKNSLPMSELIGMSEGLSSTRGFRNALIASGCSLIAEIKTASPSKGLIRENIDPLEVARIYEDNGANCISVLTDERYFRGSLDRLSAVRGIVDLPLLRKDFIIDAYQIYEARHAGADAVLLIAACLENDTIREFADLACELGLDTLIEVHNEDEMTRVVNLDADLIGINNRDLTTFVTDLAVTGRLAAMAPERAVLVSESGMFTSDDVREVSAMGADAVLIGEAIMREPDMAAKVRELAGAVVRDNF